MRLLAIAALTLGLNLSAQAAECGFGGADISGLNLSNVFVYEQKALLLGGSTKSLNKALQQGWRVYSITPLERAGSGDGKALVVLVRAKEKKPVEESVVLPLTPSSQEPPPAPKLVQ